MAKSPCVHDCQCHTTCDFFGGIFRHFAKNIFIIRYSVTKLPVLKKKSIKKGKKIQKIRQNMPQSPIISKVA
jgi:hypothetical protein